MGTEQRLRIVRGIEEVPVRAGSTETGVEMELEGEGEGEVEVSPGGGE